MRPCGEARAVCRHVQVGGLPRHQAVQVLEGKGARSAWVWARVDDFQRDEGNTFGFNTGSYIVELLDGEKRCASAAKPVAAANP